MKAQDRDWVFVFLITLLIALAVLLFLPTQEKPKSDSKSRLVKYDQIGLEFPGHKNSI